MVAYQNAVAWHAKAAGAKRLEGPVELRLQVFVKGRRGDLSNYVKQIEDALNGIAWKDDRQVVEIRAQFCEVTGHEGVDVEILER